MGKKKDSDAPKRPQSAYMLWLNANREKMKERNPDKTQAELLKILGAQWKEINDDEKQKWEHKAKGAREDYQKAKQEYDLKRKDMPESDDSDDDTKKKKKKRTKKDKNAPKRPASAYMLWLNSNREKIKAEFPGIKMTDIAKKGGEQWKTVSQEDKAKFEAQALKLKEKYTHEMDAYRSLNPKKSSSAAKKSASSSKAPAKKAAKPKPVRFSSFSVSLSLVIALASSSDSPLITCLAFVQESEDEEEEEEDDDDEEEEEEEEDDDDDDN